MPDQLLLYDQSITTWIDNNFPQLLPGRDTKILLYTARKAFADIHTGQVVDFNRTLPLPRIHVQRLDSENDPRRYNANRVRRLGYCNPTKSDRLISGKFPAPIILPYHLFCRQNIFRCNL